MNQFTVGGGPNADPVVRWGESARQGRSAAQHVPREPVSSPRRRNTIYSRLSSKTVFPDACRARQRDSAGAAERRRTRAAGRRQRATRGSPGRSHAPRSRGARGARHRDLVRPGPLRPHDRLRPDPHAGGRRRCQPHAPVRHTREAHLRRPRRRRPGARPRPVRPDRRRMGSDSGRSGRARYHRDGPRQRPRRRRHGQRRNARRAARGTTTQ